MLNQCYKVLDRLRLPHGLYLASTSKYYQHVWIRDSFYMSLPFLDKQDSLYEKTYHRLFDLFRDYEWKIEIHTKQKPNEVWEYIHSRYSAEDVKEMPEPWGHAQHDSIGAFLFGVGKGVEQGKKVIRDEKDRILLEKLVEYLECVEYWKDPDNGMWEENREVHASSVGACVAGLRSISSIVEVKESMIQLGEKTLHNLFPRESETKAADLAQLSLIYPYGIYQGKEAMKLVTQVERELLRDKGVIRYHGDSYYSTLEEEHGRDHPRTFFYGTEAEWTFGLSWLALCYLEFLDEERAAFYLNRAKKTMLEPGVFPELYFSNSSKPGPNTPLGWSTAMFILALEGFRSIYNREPWTE